MDEPSPLAIAAVVVAVLITLGRVLIGRRSEFELGVYGPAGGAVCPRCGKPYSRGMLSPNLLVGKLGRCPHCGKLALVRRASAAELEAAEVLLGEPAQTRPDTRPDLERMIEESKFEN